MNIIRSVAVKLSHILQAVLIVFLTVLATRAEAENCGQDELIKCAQPLQLLHPTSDFTNITKKDEFVKLCPDLFKGLNCIRSFTRRCMTLKQRNNFLNMYHGTGQLIHELCREGPYQDEFLRHAPCLREVRPFHEVCAKRYQDTMAAINEDTMSPPSETDTNATDVDTDNISKIVCCSFLEYLTCSETTTREMCGQEASQFTRGFLHKMSRTMVSTYCETFSGTGECGSNASWMNVGNSSILIAALLFVFRVV